MRMQQLVLRRRSPPGDAHYGTPNFFILLIPPIGYRRNPKNAPIRPRANRGSEKPTHRPRTLNRVTGKAVTTIFTT